MRGTLTVAAREVTERRLVLVAALVAGLVPFLAPLLPTVGRRAASDAREAMALIVAAGFGLGVALILGASVVGRDLAEGRLSFDFSRPLAGWSIWAGRFLGALAVTLLAIAGALLPTIVAGGAPAVGVLAAPAPWGGLGVLAAILLLLPLAHAVSLGFRSRSPWLAADLAAAVAVVLLVGFAARSLYVGFALETLEVSARILAAAAIVAFWGAAASQVTQGRTDLRRGHRALSLTLWPLLLVAALAFFGYQRWVVSASPADLEHIGVVAPPSGNWLYAAGSSPGRGDYLSALLIDAGSGRFVRLGAQAPWDASAAFSTDGRRAAWLRFHSPSDPGADLMLVDLTHPEAGPRDTLIGFENAPSKIALSADGGRLAAFSRERLSVFATDSGRLLASARLPWNSDSWLPLLFFDDGRVRTARFSPGLEIAELDIASRALATYKGAEVNFSLLAWNRRGNRLLADEIWKRSTRNLLLDGRTGALIAVLGSAEPVRRRTCRFLDDDRIVVGEGDATGTRLLLYDGDGVAERTFDLGDRVFLGFGAEAAPGKLVVAVGREGTAGREGAWPAGSEVLLVDLATGRGERIGTDLAPVTAPAYSGPGVTIDQPEPGSVATRLFRDGDALVVYQPESGVWRTVAGRRTPSPD